MEWVDMIWRGWRDRKGSQDISACYHVFGQNAGLI